MVKSLTSVNRNEKRQCGSKPTKSILKKSLSWGSAFFKKQKNTTTKCAKFTASIKKEPSRRTYCVTPCKWFAMRQTPRSSVRRETTTVVRTKFVETIRLKSVLKATGTWGSPGHKSVRSRRNKVTFVTPKHRRSKTPRKYKVTACKWFAKRGTPPQLVHISKDISKAELKSILKASVTWGCVGHKSTNFRKKVTFVTPNYRLSKKRRKYKVSDCKWFAKRGEVGLTQLKRMSKDIGKTPLVRFQTVESMDRIMNETVLPFENKAAQFDSKTPFVRFKTMESSTPGFENESKVDALNFSEFENSHTPGAPMPLDTTGIMDTGIMGTPGMAPFRGFDVTMCKVTPDRKHRIKITSGDMIQAGRCLKEFQHATPGLFHMQVDGPAGNNLVQANGV